MILKSGLKNVAQFLSVLCSGKKPLLILFSVMFLTDNFKIHVVVYMKKVGNFIKAMQKQYCNLSGKVA